MRNFGEPIDIKQFAADLMSLWGDLNRIYSAYTDANVAAGKAEGSRQPESGDQ